MPLDHLLPSEVASLIDSTFVREAHYFDELDSTNDWLLRFVDASPAAATSSLSGHCAAAGVLPATSHFGSSGLCGQRWQTPMLVVAAQQTKGRGRGSNRWWSGEGSLTCSLLVHAGTWGLSPQQFMRMSLVTGLAVRQTLARIAVNSAVQVKWPNDVYLQGHKVSGILLERPARAADYLVIGIGINVNVGPRDAPEEVRAQAISLQEVRGQPTCRAGLLGELLRDLESHYRQLAGEAFSLAAAWREHCILSGRRVTAVVGARRLTGLVLGIDDEGMLLLQTTRGIERIVSAVVEQF